MGRIVEPFSYNALQKIIDSAKARNVELRKLDLTPAHYRELRNDVKDKLGLDLPETVDDQHPLLFSGLQVNVWRPKAHVRKLSNGLAARDFDSIR